VRPFSAKALGTLVQVLDLSDIAREDIPALSDRPLRYVLIFAFPMMLLLPNKGSNHELTQLLPLSEQRAPSDLIRDLAQPPNAVADGKSRARPLIVERLDMKENTAQVMRTQSLISALAAHYYKCGPKYPQSYIATRHHLLHRVGRE
jgi:hypothetical protein